jgi:hypothetical protein
MRLHALQGLTIENDSTVIGRNEIGQHVKQRRLTRAIWPEYANNLASANLHTHLLDRMEATKALVNTIDF